MNNSPSASPSPGSGSRRSTDAGSRPSTAAGSGTPADAGSAASVAKPRLNRGLGTTSIVFMVVAAAAPITVVAANFPIIFMSSGSAAVPLMILAATIILLLFSVGFTRMSLHVPDAGAFYSYVRHGLGRRMGLGTAGLALVSYLLLTVSMTCYLGVQATNLIEQYAGAAPPWWLVSAIMLIIVAFLGYRDIELSAKVLGTVLVLEVVAVVALDVGVVASGGELSATPFSVREAASGAPGLGLLFAFLGFFGFEATAVFRNEARDPERTIPRATYAAVAIIGLLYTVSAWLVASAIGPERVVAASESDPENVVIDLAGAVVAPILHDVFRVLVVTSMFACMLAFHNIVARYLFSLGERGALPESLAVVHADHRSPATASAWTSAITAVIVAVSALGQLDPVTQIYTWYSGAGAVGVIAMMALTCVAVLVFFGRRNVSAAGPVTLVLTALGGAGLLGVLVLSVVNLPLLAGGTVPAIACVVLLAAFFAAGCAWRR